MPKLTPITNSFTLGEVSPLVYGRSDIDGYREGAQHVENMFVDSRGPAISRKGSKFVEAFTGSTGRMAALPVSDDFFYSMTFLDKKLFVSSGVGHAPSGLLSVNPAFALLSAGWHDTEHGSGSVDFTTSGATLHIPSSANQIAQISQEVTGLAPNTIHVVEWTLAGASTGEIRVGTSEGAGDILALPTSASSIIEFDTGPDTRVWITLILDSDLLQADQTLTVSYFAVAHLSTGVLEYTTPYLEKDLELIQTVQAPVGNAIYVLHEFYPPYKITYDRATDAFAWTIVTFTGQPAEWANGSYPRTGTFFQGRLWLAGPPLNASTFWASKSGLPENFTLGVLDDDGLEFTLNQFGAIQWMAGFKSLMIGTSSGEQIITSQGAYISPSDISIEQQSSYGSAAVQPVQVGDQIFYVSADRVKLRAIQYEWQADNWLSKDLTFNSEHITRSGIKRIVWHQNPKNLLHCVLNDGTLASLTYERGSDTYGWTRVIMQKQVKDLTTGPVQGTDYLHGLIYHGDNKLYLETQAQTPEYNNMDSWIERPVRLGSGFIDGLEHLEGETVQIQVEGAVYPDQVVTGGVVQVSELAEGVAAVGLQFTVRLVTLPLAAGNQAGSDTIYQKRWNQIVVRALASGKPIINGQRPATRRAPTPMDTVEPQASEDFEVVNLGLDTVAVITIEQDLPLDLTVIALFGKVSSSVT